MPRAAVEAHQTSRRNRRLDRTESVCREHSLLVPRPQTKLQPAAAVPRSSPSLVYGMATYVGGTAGLIAGIVAASELEASEVELGRISGPHVQTRWTHHPVPVGIIAQGSMAVMLPRRKRSPEFCSDPTVATLTTTILWSCGWFGATR